MSVLDRRCAYCGEDCERTCEGSQRPNAAPLLSQDEEARLASILVSGFKVSPAPDAAPPKKVPTLRSLVGSVPKTVRNLLQRKSWKHVV